MEIWTNGKKPKETSEQYGLKFSDLNSPKPKQSKGIGCGTMIFWWVVMFCICSFIYSKF